MRTSEKNAEILLGKLIDCTKFENKIFSVGGFVRDELMGIKSKDLDLVVNIDGGSKSITHFIKQTLKDTVTNPHNLGNGYPIWEISFRDNVVIYGKTWGVKEVVLEFSDTQNESFTDNNSRQRSTTFGTIEEDVLRRDFTCNMIMRNISSGEILDLSNGVNDIKSGVLRSHPEVSFDEILSNDPLRMMRMIRFKTRFGWKVNEEDIESVKRNAHRIKIISAERINDELTKIMNIGKLSDAIHFMKDVGILEYVFPEVNKMIGAYHDTNQPFHKECDYEVFGHVMMVLENAKHGVVPQMSALLHDIGKPVVREIDKEGRVRFSKHELVGSKMALDVLKRLKFDTKTIDSIVKIIEMHGRPHDFGRNGENPSIKSVRKLIRDAGDDLEELLNLSEADCLGNLPVRNNIPTLRSLIKEVQETTSPIVKKSILNGNEIMDVLDIKKGSGLVGDVMDFLIDFEDEQCDKGIPLTKELAKEFIKNNFKEI